MPKQVTTPRVVSRSLERRRLYAARVSAGVDRVGSEWVDATVVASRGGRRRGGIAARGRRDGLVGGRLGGDHTANTLAHDVDLEEDGVVHTHQPSGGRVHQETFVVGVVGDLHGGLVGGSHLEAERQVERSRDRAVGQGERHRGGAGDTAAADGHLHLLGLDVGRDRGGRWVVRRNGPGRHGSRCGSHVRLRMGERPQRGGACENYSDNYYYSKHNEPPGLGTLTRFGVVGLVLVELLLKRLHGNLLSLGVSTNLRIGISPLMP